MDLGALELALAQHAQPGRVEELRERPLPAGMTELLRAALGQDDVVEAAARCHQASRAQIVDAARFFIEQQVLARAFESDPWRQLGLAPDADEEALKIHHRLLVRLVHPDRSDDWADAYADRVNRAWRQLRDPETRHRATAVAAAAHQGWGRTANAGASRAALVVTAPEPAPSMPAPASRPGLWIAMAGMVLVASVAGLIWVAGPAPAHDPLADDDATASTRSDAPRAATKADDAPLEPGAAPMLPTPVPIALLIPNPTPATTATADPDSDPDNFAVAPEPAPAVQRRVPAPTRTTRPALPSANAAPIVATPVAPAVAIVMTEAAAHDATAANPSPPVPIQHALPSDGETIALIDRYANRYAAGDLDGVLALFASDVHADSTRVAPIASGLAQAFRDTSRRDLRIERLQWQRHPDRITGQARYRLSQQARGGFVRRTEWGRIEFELVREGDDARLRQLVTRPDPRS